MYREGRNPSREKLFREKPTPPLIVGVFPVYSSIMKLFKD